MKYLTLELIPRIIGFLLWSCCLVVFPTAWALITLGLGAFQVTRCQKSNKIVNALFKKRMEHDVETRIHRV